MRTKDGNANDFGDLPMFKAHARNTDPHTSHEAAEGVRGQLPLLEGKVLEAIESSPTGMNAWEIESTTNIPNQTCTPRLAPLRRKGLIVDSGERRPGSTGKKQIVWKGKNI